MFQQTFVPTAEHHSVELPDELWGKKVEVVAVVLGDIGKQQRSIERANDFFDSAQIDFTGFKFDRDEANER